MRKGIIVDVAGADRTRLEAIVGNGNTPQKHAWRARIVLLTAERLGTNEIMHRTGKSKSVIWRWQERFMLEVWRGCCATSPARPAGRRWASQSSTVSLP